MSNIGTLPPRAIVSLVFFTVRALLVLSLLAAVAGLMACGSALQSVAHATAPAGNNNSPHVSLTPLNPSIPSEGKLQFTALVNNTSDTGVVWSASAGTISSNGLFVAPKVTVQRTISVTATSAAAASSRATVAVAVIPPQALSITTSSLNAAQIGSSYDTNLSANGGTAPYQWTVTSGALPTGLQLSRLGGVISGVPSESGTSAFTVTLKDATTNETTRALALTVSPGFAGSFDGPAELPRVYLQTTLADTPAPGKTINVNAGGDFQAALNSAACGDTITLQEGATFGGVFYLRHKSCDAGHWIIIRTSAPDSSLPPEGTRITPCYAGVASLPGRPHFNCTATRNVMAKLAFINKTGFGPVVFESGANHYRLIGLEITRSAGTSVVFNLMTPGNKATADHIVLDRLWVHGTARDETTRGVYLAGITSAAVIDSFFTDFHCVAVTGGCIDSQAIGGGGGDNPAGPYKIVDNFLEAAGENVLFGGGVATTTPADIEIRQNHLFKPLLWMPGQPGFVGGIDGHPFIVKNNFELKNAQRVLFEGNIAEYTWGGFSQAGYAIGITPKNQAGNNGSNLCPSCLVTDVTIRYSTVSHAAAGINIANVKSANGGSAKDGRRYSIHDITIDDINGNVYMGGGPLLLMLSDWTSNVLGDVSINHITGFGDPTRPVLTVGNESSYPKMSHFVYTNNVVIGGEYAVWSSGGKTNCAYSGTPISILEDCFRPYTFVKNAVIAPKEPRFYDKWPSGNSFPHDTAVMQFVNYNNANGGDYHLLPSSPYKNAGTDGKDLGADIDAIMARIANAY